MSVTININGNVESLVVNTNQGASITANGTEVWSAAKPYLTFSSAAAFTLDSMALASGDPIPWDGTLETSTDAATWATWDGTTVNSAASGGTHYIYLRGSGNTLISGGQYKGLYVDGNAPIDCDGDIRTLLDYADPASASMGQGCFSYLFDSCAALTKGPDLPATALSLRCYQAMFIGCSGLTEAPSLPATTLEAVCYMNMFKACTSLTTAPSLPATTLATTCYSSMFDGCTSLTSIPALPATSVPSLAYAMMFRGCSLVKVSETQTGEYQTEYRIPTEGTGTFESGTSAPNMFQSTGGTFTSAPTVNTTYYTSNRVIL